MAGAKPRRARSAATRTVEEAAATDAGAPDGLDELFGEITRPIDVIPPSVDSAPSTALGETEKSESSRERDEQFSEGGASDSSEDGGSSPGESDAAEETPIDADQGEPASADQSPMDSDSAVVPPGSTTADSADASSAVRLGPFPALSPDRPRPLAGQPARPVREPGVAPDRDDLRALPFDLAPIGRDRRGGPFRFHPHTLRTGLGVLIIAGLLLACLLAALSLR